MSTKPHRDPRNTKSVLGRAYWQHHARVIIQMQPRIMGHVTTAVLEGIESFATGNPDSSVAQMHEEMLSAIAPDVAAGDPQTVSRFSELYDSAYDAVFPATRAYLKVRHEVDEISSSLSLSVFDLVTLHAFDLEAHRNDILGTFRKELTSRLNKVKGIDDVSAFGRLSRSTARSSPTCTCANECKPIGSPNARERRHLTLSARCGTARPSLSR